MELLIKQTDTVGDLKKQFSALFPNLKISFFKQKHRQKQASSPAKRLHAETLLQVINPKLSSGIFQFSSQCPVADFEQRLQREFGLPVQIFRRSGNAWLETIQTDERSLWEQNAMGAQQLSTFHFNEHTLFL